MPLLIPISANFFPSWSLPTDEEIVGAIEDCNRAVGQEEEMRGCAGCGRIFAIDDLTIYELGPDLKHLRKDAAFAAQWRAKAPWHVPRTTSSSTAASSTPSRRRS